MVTAGQLIGTDPHPLVMIDARAHLVRRIDPALILQPQRQGQSFPRKAVAAPTQRAAVQVHQCIAGGALQPRQVITDPGVDTRRIRCGALGWAIAGDAGQPGAAVIVIDQRSAAVSPAGIASRIPLPLQLTGAQLAISKVGPVTRAALRSDVIQRHLMKHPGALPLSVVPHP